MKKKKDRHRSYNKTTAISSLSSGFQTGDRCAPKTRSLAQTELTIPLGSTSSLCTITPKHGAGQPHLPQNPVIACWGITTWKPLAVPCLGVITAKKEGLPAECKLFSRRGRLQAGTGSGLWAVVGRFLSYRQTLQNENCRKETFQAKFICQLCYIWKFLTMILNITTSLTHFTTFSRAPTSVCLLLLPGLESMASTGLHANLAGSQGGANVLYGVPLGYLLRLHS